MKNRSYERMPFELKVQFLYFNSMYHGTIKNISQNGMYIETNESQPFHSKFDVHIPFRSKIKILINSNNNVLEVPARVKRLVKNGAAFTGMGVKLLNPSPNYMDFMSSLISSN